MKKSMFDAGSVLPRPFAPIKAPVVEEEPQEQTETAFFESVTEDAMLEAVSKLATSNLRQEAAAAVVQWIEGGDADFDELDSLLYGLAGGEDDEELSDSGIDAYDDLLTFAGEYIANVSSADETDIELMYDDEEAAERVFNAVESALSGVDSDESISEFAVRESMMTEAVKKVIRNGEMKLIKKPKRKRRLSSAQKAALKKARRKANTGAAKAARKKSMRKRKSRGL